MFVRVKTRNNTQKKAVQIVKSHREKGRVRQKVILTVGYAHDNEGIQKLVDMANHLKIRLEVTENPTLFDQDFFIELKSRGYDEKSAKKTLVNLYDLRNEGRVITGIHQVYGNIYDLLDFQNLLPKQHLAKAKVIKQLAMARLANPKSKKGSVAMLKKDFGLEVDLTKVYRTMDFIDDKVIENIQKKSFEATQSILKKKIHVVFYDCTTLYFESFNSDELKSNGYSKDGKFNQPQVLLSLSITEEGLPLGYDVFPGSTFEGNTFETALDTLKKKYELSDIIIVADSGLLTKKNIAYVEQLGYHYILGARLKSLPFDKQDEIQRSIGQAHVTRLCDYITKSCETFHESQRLIVRYSEKRAKKDFYDRQDTIDKLKKRLLASKNPTSFLSNYGYKKYLKYTGTKGNVEMDEKKLEEAQRWDGLSGVFTNLKDRPREEVLYFYKELWQIESCFRVQKHDLKIRPIYHWTPRRIKAHIALCYMSFCCQQYLRYRLKLQKESMSVEVIRSALIDIQRVILKDIETGKLYGIPSKLNDQASKIYKIMRFNYSAVPFEIGSG